MSYTTDDQSVELGSRRDLYTWSVAGVTYRYTSHQTDVTYDSNTFTALAGLACPAIAVPGLDSAESIEVSLPRSTPMIYAMTGGAALPEYAATLTITRLQIVSGAVKQLYTGDVVSVARQGREAMVGVRHQLAGAKLVTIPRIAATRQCGHELYEAGCDIDREAGGGALYKHTTNIASIATTVEFDVDDIDAAYEDTDYAGGEVRIGTTRRTIMSITGVTVRVLGPLLVLDGGSPVPGAGISVGDEVLLYVGCDRSLETCDAKFDNVLKFGGTPFIGVSPKPFKVRPI